MDEFIKKVLPVVPVAFDKELCEKGELSQISAEQWLSFVRSQTASLPDVVVASSLDMNQFAGQQTNYVPQVESVVECPERRLLPSREWEMAVMDSFGTMSDSMRRLSELSTYKERRIAVPNMKDEIMWHKFCFGMGIDSDTDVDVDVDVDAKLDQHMTGPVVSETLADNILNIDELLMQKRSELEKEEKEKIYPEMPVKPTLRLILQFDQCMTQKLLKFHVAWLSSCKLDDCRLHLDLRVQWIHCLMGRLAHPQHKDTEAVIRQLYRRCCWLRANLNFNDNDSENNLACLNLCIVIAGRYFGQGQIDVDSRFNTIEGRS
jgi:hypothetical protein